MSSKQVRLAKELFLAGFTILSDRQDYDPNLNQLTDRFSNQFEEVELPVRACD
jgi:hypothetical protein